MQFSTRSKALAALLAASGVLVQACPSGYHRVPRPSSTSSAAPSLTTSSSSLSTSDVLAPSSVVSSSVVSSSVVPSSVVSSSDSVVPSSVVSSSVVPSSVVSSSDIASSIVSSSDIASSVISSLSTDIASSVVTSSSSVDFTTTPATLSTTTPVIISSTSTEAPVPTSVSVTSSVSVTAPTTTSSTTSSASSAPTSGLTSDQQAALDAHNAARQEVGEAPLVWDTSLVADAQAWADALAAQNSPGTLVHASQTGEGENLYWQSNADAPYVSAANAWIAEKPFYTPGTTIGTGNFEAYGHYTQIIWASTTNVGMAIASDGVGGYYVVARYTPQGNYVGEIPTQS